MGIVLAVVVLGAVLAALAAPLDLSVAIERHAAFKARISLRWLGIHWTLRPGATRKSRKTKNKKPGRDGSANWRMAPAILRVPGLWAHLRRLLRRLRAAVRVRRIAARIRFGFDDPADTGRLWGVVAAAMMCLEGRETVDVRVEPDFENALWSVELDGVVRLFPALAVYGLTRSVFSTTTVRVLTAVIRTRRAQR